MVEPLSIISGVAGLLSACVKLGFDLKQFHDGAVLANAAVKGLMTDVEGFVNVLNLMKATLEQPNVQSSLHSSGHIGNHWSNISKSIEDAGDTLARLEDTLEKVNKSVKFLDGARKHLRLKSASEEIAVFHVEIRSYRDTLQLSMQTVILYVK
jgi:hypothetical protein